jgi:hypothetical protein
VLKTERGNVNAVLENLRMPQEEVAAVAITWALSQVLRQFPSIAPREVREALEADVERFERELKGRARRSKSRGRELSKGR